MNQFDGPERFDVEIQKVSGENLPQLIQLKLAARRFYDLGDVSYLIRVHNLDESFLETIHSAFRQDFLVCLDEARREMRRDEEDDARED